MNEKQPETPVPEPKVEMLQKVQVSITKTASVRSPDNDQIIYELEVTNDIVKIRRLQNRRGGVRLVDLAAAIKELSA